MAMNKQDVQEVQNQAKAFVQKTIKEFQQQLQELNRDKRQLLTLMFLLSLFNTMLRDERLQLWKKMPKDTDKLQEKLLDALQHPESYFNSHSFLRRINIETASELVREVIYQEIYERREAMGHWNALLEQKEPDQLYMPDSDVDLFVKRVEEMQPVVQKRAQLTHQKADASIKQQLASRLGTSAGSVALSVVVTGLVAAGSIAGSVVTCGAVAAAVFAVSAVAFLWYRHKKRKKFNQLNQFFSKKEKTKHDSATYKSSSIKEMDDALTEAAFERPDIAPDRMHKKLPKADVADLNIDDVTDLITPAIGYQGQS